MTMTMHAQFWLAKKCVQFHMAPENSALMQECSPKHPRRGATLLRQDRYIEKKARRDEGPEENVYLTQNRHTYNSECHPREDVKHQNIYQIHNEHRLFALGGRFFK